MYTFISCLAVRTTLLCSSPGLLLLSLTCTNVPSQRGEERDTSLCFWYNTGGSFIPPRICSIFIAFEESFPHFNNNNEENILIIQRNSLVAFFTLEVKIPGQLQGSRVSLSNERMHANTRTWTQVFRSKRSLLTTPPVWPFSFQTWALSWICNIGSQEVVITWWPALDQRVFKSLRWMGRERGAWRGVEAPGPGLTLSLPGPTLTLLFPPTLEPRPRGAVTSEWRVTERPVGLAGTASGAAQSEEGVIDGGWSEGRRNESCLCEERMFGLPGVRGIEPRLSITAEVNRPS